MKPLLLTAAIALLSACGGSEPAAPTSTFTPDRSSPAAFCASVCDGADATAASGSTCECRCGLEAAGTYRATLVFDVGEDPAFWHSYWGGFRANCAP